MATTLNVRFVVFFAALLAAIPLESAAKPSKVPVSVEFFVPKGVKTGDLVTTVLKFRALSDIQRLEVIVAPFAGVDLVSSPREASFTDVKKGEAPQLEVTVRLTDSKFGSLAVTYRTETVSARAAGAITIVYGDPNQ